MSSTEQLRQQVIKLTEVIETQQAELEELNAEPNPIGTVIGVYDKSLVVDSAKGPMEVNKPKEKLEVGSSVKLNKSLQVIGRSEFSPGGVPGTVIRVFGTDAEIESGSGNIVLPVNGVKLDSGDVVLLSRSGNAILKKLDSSKRFSTEKTSITWDDVGGNEEAKKHLIEAVEWPTKMKTLYSKFGKSPLKGVLLWGPPGNGKTLLAKAASTSLALLGGAKSNGFFSIRGPEVLSKWVGEGEGMVRMLFSKAKRQSKLQGFQSVIFVDEADAILKSRGQQRNSYTDTIVNQFLAEMDGIEESGALVILATNRPDILDPAITRDGRIDRKVEVPTPSFADGIEIAKIHLKKIPVHDITRDDAAHLIVECGINRPDFSGAFIAGAVDRSTSHAIRRSLTEKVVGVTRSDFQTVLC